MSVSEIRSWDDWEELGERVRDRSASEALERAFSKEIPDDFLPEGHVIPTETDTEGLEYIPNSITDADKPEPPGAAPRQSRRKVMRRVLDVREARVPKGKDGKPKVKIYRPDRFNAGKSPRDDRRGSILAKSIKLELIDGLPAAE